MIAAAAIIALLVIIPLPATASQAPQAPPPGAATPAPPIAATPPVSAGAADERLVAATLRRFADAYEQLDADAVIKVWPKADRRVLTRAFDAIESQEVYFARCDIQVANSGATASCGGWLRYVPKVGKKEPRFLNRRWDFALQKGAGEWRITTTTVR